VHFKKDLPNVTLLGTGGTVASRLDYRTGAVRPALSASDLYSVVPELSDIAIIDAETAVQHIQREHNCQTLD
jgi:glutamyl-tRNA(Gln) amidotransferase subunit D